MAKVLIALVTYERDEQYLPLLIERLKRQDCQDWGIACIDTTRAAKPGAAAYAPRLVHALRAAFPEHEATVEEYPVPDAPEHVWRMVGNCRNRLRERFLASGAERLLFLDGDVLLPPHGLSCLLSHDAPAVSGVYLGILPFRDVKTGQMVRRIMPVAWMKHPTDPLKSHPVRMEAVLRPRVLRIFYCGFGCVLLSRDAASVRIPVEELVKGSEDIPFYVELDRRGIPLLLDTRVGCAHLQWPPGDARNAKLDVRNYALSAR